MILKNDMTKPEICNSIKVKYPDIYEDVEKLPKPFIFNILHLSFQNRDPFRYFTSLSRNIFCKIIFISYFLTFNIKKLSYTKKKRLSRGKWQKKFFLTVTEKAPEHRGLFCKVAPLTPKKLLSMNN